MGLQVRILPAAPTKAPKIGQFKQFFKEQYHF